MTLQKHSHRRRWKRRGPLADSADRPPVVNAGLLYLQGEPALRDEAKAFKWLLLAAAQGNLQAGDIVESLLKKLTREQISEAATLVSEWRPEGRRSRTCLIRSR